MNPVNDRIKQVCDQLDNEAIYHWSLQSKELFHSNVIAWLFEKYPDAAFEMLKHWSPSRETTAHRIQREKGNLDLIVEVPRLAPLVIENKVFSPPDESQLDRYSSKNIDDLVDPVYILLSLGSPHWEESKYVSSSGVEWKYMSYRDLAELIRKAAVAVHGFDNSLLIRYAELVEGLQELADEFSHISDAQTLVLNQETTRVLKKVRLDSAFVKLRARSVIAYLRDSMTNNAETKPIKFSAGYTNTEPLVEAFVQLQNNDEIGWQLQGNQWRLAIRTAHHVGEGENLRQLRFEHVRQNYQAWFDFSAIPDLIGKSVDKVPTNEKKGIFNRYDPNFVYWHREIPDLTISEIKKLSEHYINQAQGWE